MQIAKVIDGQIVNIANCRDVYNRVVPTDEQLAQKSYVRVNLFKPHDRLTQKLVPCAPVLEGEWVYMMEIQQMTDEEIQAAKDSAMAEIRSNRNRMLQETDGTQAVDNPSPKKPDWAAYRQELRDLPATIAAMGADPRTFDAWPTAPI